MELNNILSVLATILVFATMLFVGHPQPPNLYWLTGAGEGRVGA